MKIILWSLIFCNLICCAHQKRVETKVFDEIVSRYPQVTPGLVLSLGTVDRGVVYRRAYGNASLKPTVRETTVETPYDIASITKLFTATSIAILVEEGKLRYNSKVVDFFPEFATSEEKRTITIEDLLRHKSGLPEYFEKKQIYDSKSLENTWKAILETPLVHKPRSQFLYSNTGYMILAKIVAQVSHISFDRFVTERIFKPLNMQNSFFVSFRKDCAPTSPDGLKPCVVDDIWAQRLEGVAGHDSIFSTAVDLEQFCLFLLGEKPYLLKAETLEHMTTLKEGEVQGLGPDLLSEYSDAPRGDYFHKGKSFGHTGFTGTSVWIDPKRKSYLIILGNRQHLTRENIRPMRRELANAAAQYLDAL